MTEKNDVSDLNMEQPIKAYILPPEEPEHDEVDLWRMFLTLLKYKLQISLFLLIGLIVGIAAPWFRKQTSEAESHTQAPVLKMLKEIQDIEQSASKQRYQDQLSAYLKEKSDLKKLIYQKIDQIPEGKQALELTGAEYHYTVLDNPVTPIKMKAALHMVLKEDVLKTQTRDYQIVYKVGKTTISSLKKRLRQVYTDIEDLNNRILPLDLKRREINLRQYLLEKGLSPNQNVEGGTRSQQISSLSAELSVINAKLDPLLKNRGNKEFQRKLIQQTLAEQINFNVGTNGQVPANLWQALKKAPSAIHNSYRPRISEIEELFVAKHNSEQQIQKLKMIDYIYANSIKLPDVDIKKEKNLPSSAKELLELTKKRTKKDPPKKAEAKHIDNFNIRFLLISLAIAFFWGLASVYVRYMIRKVRVHGGFGKYRREFMEALKYWKF